MSLAFYAQGSGLDPWAYVLAKMAQRAFMTSVANQALTPPFSFFWLGQMLATATGIRVLFANENTTSGTGLALLLSAAEKPQWRVNNSIPAAVNVTYSGTLSASPNIIGILCCYDGTTSKLSVNRNTFQTNTPATGGFSAAVSRKFVLGNNSTGGGAGAEPVDTTTLGLVYSDAVQSQADSDAMFDACKAAVDVVAFPTGTSTGWSVKQAMSDLVAKPIFSPSFGSLFDLTLQGTSYTRSPLVTPIPQPTFAW